MFGSQASVTRLPNIVYFHGGYQEKPFECTDSISEVLGCTYSLPGTWGDLTRELEAGAEYVAFHADYVLKKGNRSIKEFAEAIFTLAERMPNFTKLNIGVVIKRDTDASVIEELKRSKVSGILLDVHDYSMEEVCAATTALISDKPYWPEHIISRLPDSPVKPISVFFRKNAKNYINRIENDYVKELEKLPWQGKLCESWDELSEMMKLNPHQMLFHVSMIDGVTVSEFVSMLETLMTVSLQKKIPIGIAIEKDTPLSLIKEFQKNNLQGIIPGADSFGFKETINGLTALFDRIPHWPEHIISQLPASAELPLSIYFREDWKTYITPAMLETFKENARFDVAYCSDWADLDEALAKTPHQLIFHISMLDMLNSSVEELMTMLKTRVRLAGLDIPIAVGIEPTTTVNIVKQLKSNGVFSITPSAAHWGLTEITTAMNSLFDRIPYWPEHIINQLPEGKLRYIYFRDSSELPICIDEKTAEIYKEVLPLELVPIVGWDKLDSSLNLDIHGIIINVINIFNNPNLTLQEIISMIQSKMKILDLDVPIIVGINNDTPKSIIKQLKNEDIHSICPTHKFGIDEVVLGMESIVKGIPYWPEHIISRLPEGKPRYIYFRDEDHTHITPELQELFKNELPIDMVHVVGWEKLDNALRYDPVALAFNIRTLSYNPNLTLQEIISMIRSQMKIVNADIPLVVGINKDTPQSIIKQLKKEGIHSICPTIEFGLDEIRKAIQSILDGVPHWPKHIIDQLPGSAKKKKVPPGKITLTIRQSQILKLIKERGAPNKVIANALNISESTVKLHVGCILKKYALTNRTQLVVLDLKDHVA